MSPSKNAITGLSVIGTILWTPVDQPLRKVESAWEQDHSDRVPDRVARQATGTDDIGRRLKATKASDIAMKATRWLWEDGRGCWIPTGALVLLGGREGVGKSTVCADLVARVTQGELSGDFQGKPQAVIICTTEDDWRATVKPRVVAAGADLDKVFRVNAVSPEGFEGTLSLPEDTKQLEELIREHDVALIILDPLLSVVNAKLDTHKDAEVRRGLEPIVQIAHDTRSSVIGLIHVNKSNEGDLMNRLMGSRALGALLRGVLFCARYAPNEQQDTDDAIADQKPDRGQFVFGQIKNNLAPKIMESLQYHVATEIVGYDAEAQKDIKASQTRHPRGDRSERGGHRSRAGERRRSVRTQGAKAETWLVGFLTGKGEVPSKFVLKAGKEAGFSRDAIHRARRNLEDRIEVITLPVMPKQTAWKLIPQ